MTGPVKSLLDAFEGLTEQERQEATAEILRRTIALDLPLLDDEVLAQIADETFLELDAREAADERS